MTWLSTYVGITKNLRARKKMLGEMRGADLSRNKVMEIEPDLISRHYLFDFSLF